MVERQYHEEFVKYMRKILSHTNYSGIPTVNNISFDASFEKLKSNWVCYGKSDTGIARTAWWNNKRIEFGIEEEKGWLTKTAKRNFPFEKRPCQVCGKYLSINYVYPNKNLLAKFNSIKVEEFSRYDLDINEIIEIISKSPDGLEQVKKLLDIPDSIEKNSSAYSDFILKNRKPFLSPGVMGNPPDRLDGFHSYNACCRSSHDTGRSKENLSKYGDDRRAYENWSDGNFKAASWLMKELNKREFSPDHIGPISQGFCHRPNFAPMSVEANITKRDRLGIKDLEMLLEDEQKEPVMSWHTKHVWDLLKRLPKTKKEAINLGKILRKNVHNVLTIFSKIKNEGYPDFLTQFLHPEFALTQPIFTKIEPETRTYEYYLIDVSRAEHKNHYERVIRISLESLDDYNDIKNRNVKLWEGEDVAESVKKILEHLKQKDNEGAKAALDSLFKIFAKYAKKEYEKS